MTKIKERHRDQQPSIVGAVHDTEIDLPQVMQPDMPTPEVEKSENKVVVNTPPVYDAVVQVLSVADTPFLRAEKLQAMATAAKAHAKLYELGVMNNDFLLTNAVTFSKNAVSAAVEEAKTEQERKFKKSKRVRTLLAILGTALVCGAVIAGLYFSGIVSFKI